MPTIILNTSAQCSDNDKTEIAKALSDICVNVLSKPEDYVQSMVNDDSTILFGGSSAKAAFVEVRSIGGINPENNAAISKAICDLLSDKLDIDPARVYINFFDMMKSDWGWNGATFA